MIRLVIVEDHPAIAEGLAALLRAEPDIEVLGVAKDSARAEQMIVELAPDVVLCDVMLEGSDVRLRARRPPVGPVAVPDADRVRRPELPRAGDPGGRGRVPVQDERRGRPIATTIRRIHARPSRVLAPTCSGAPRRAPATPTHRELQLLVLLAEGATNDVIATELGVRVKTVEGMLRRLFDRYDVDNRTQLARFAAHQGWVSSWVPSPSN